MIFLLHCGSTGSAIITHCHARAGGMMARMITDEYRWPEDAVSADHDGNSGWLL